MEFTNYGGVLLTGMRFPEVAHSNFSMVLCKVFFFFFFKLTLERESLFSVTYFVVVVGLTMFLQLYSALYLPLLYLSQGS